MPKENDAYRNNFNLERFIREHFASLCAMAYKLVGDQDTAQDIAQEVIIKFWENQKHDQPPESIENYLYIMIRNESLNYLRTLSREQKRHEKAYQESEHTEEAWDKIVESEANQLLLEAIKSLPPQSRRIMELAYDGKSLKETAELLEISVNTVKAIKSKALQKLKDFFSQENL